MTDVKYLACFFRIESNKLVRSIIYPITSIKHEYYDVEYFEKDCLRQFRNDLFEYNVITTL